jgi:FkbM family methyltransferase
MSPHDDERIRTLRAGEGHDGLRLVQVNRRASILLYWLRGRRNGVGALELIRFLASPPCQVKARRLIAVVTPTGDVYRVWIRSVQYPLIWPRSVDLYWLYMVIAEQFYSRDWHYYETPETMVERGDVVADCGASEGLFTLRAACRAEKVFAIEPLPLWVSCMRQTFAEVSNVEIIECALADRPGSSTLHAGGLDSQLRPDGHIPVSVETIDNLFARRAIPVSYIKADLEGHDFRMLQGASETILTYAPRIAVTTYHDPVHADKMISFLRRLNGRYRFQVKGIDAGAGAPVMLHAWV